MEVKKFITRLMYFSVGLAGLMTAIIILVSPEGGTIGKAISTTFLIFLADGVILMGLLAKHEWLKIGTWVTAVYALAMSTIYTWMPKAIFKDYDYDSSGNRFLANEDIVNTTSTFAHLMWGGHLLSLTFVVAVLFSLIRPSIKATDKIMQYSYYSALGLGLGSGLVLSLCASIDQGGLLLRFGFALMFLAFTAGVITVIAMIVSSVKAKNEMREMHLQKQREWQEANPNANIPAYGNPQSMTYPGNGYNSQPYGVQSQNYGAYPSQGHSNVSIPPVPSAPPAQAIPPVPPAPQYPAQPSHPPFHSGQSQPPFAPPAPPVPPTQNP